MKGRTKNQKKHSQQTPNQKNAPRNVIRTGAQIKIIEKKKIGSFEKFTFDNTLEAQICFDFFRD